MLPHSLSTHPAETRKAATRAGALDHHDAVAATTVALVRNAFTACARWRLAPWDAAVIEAARLQGCDLVLSADLSTTQDYSGIRVVNPFA